MASSSNYQLADSGIGGLMGWPTGQVQVITSQLTVGLTNGSANRTSSSDHQSANSGVVG